MNVFVTGGCGFLGSHICEYFVKRGDKVVSFDNMTKHELCLTGYAVKETRDYNWNYLKGLGVTVVKGDIRDFSKMMKQVRGSDFIVHTAAQPAMTIGISDCELDFSTNVRGTFNVLMAAKELKIPIVSCSTIHVYGNKINENLAEEETRYVRTPPAIDEFQPVTEGILTPLHASKRAAELYVQTFADTYGLRAASFRLTGLYGPRQFGGEDHGWVAHFCIRAILGRPLKIFGTGKQLRDILYATDVAEACHAFYEQGKPGIYNIGGGIDTSTSLLECIEIIKDITGKDIEVQYEESRLGDLFYFVCDTQKAKKDLQWKEKVLPKEGIKSLIDWIKEEKKLFKVES